jgi:Ca2+-binding EF-hand superfamily protein
MKKVHKIAEIFTLWDTDCSGYIHADEVIAVLSHWENFGTDEGKFQSKYKASYSDINMIVN